MAANQQANIPILTDAIVAEEPGVPAASASAPTDELDASVSGGTTERETPADHEEPDVETLIAELQTTLASSTFTLIEELMRTAFSEMEAKLHQQIAARLRRELPELIDSLLREHLARDRDA